MRARALLQNVALALALRQGATLNLGLHSHTPEAEIATLGFDDYIRLHEREYEPGSPEYHHRRELYERRVEDIERQNSQPDRMWTATINHLSDRTEAELASLRGYNRDVRPQSSGSKGAQLLEQSSRSVSLEDLPKEFSWKSLRATNTLLDQRDCGSCWALSSATVIRAHSEIYLGQDTTCSVQQIISCTPNPAECGGSGGCAGATTELAMEYVLQNGCQNDTQWPYSARVQSCPATARAQPGEVWRGLPSLLGKAADRPAERAAGSAGFGMVGYRKLPENKVAPLMLALYEQGPVAVTVAAGNAWNMYHSGVMNSCRRDAVISHAVTLLGFGEATGRRNKVHPYWLLQNSWGKRWGERGNIRLQRHGIEEEEQWCGWDRNPQAGSGCKGGPPKIWVCGSCGILYDNVVPIFKSSDPEVVARARLRQEA